AGDAPEERDGYLTLDTIFKDFPENAWPKGDGTDSIRADRGNDWVQKNLPGKKIVVISSVEVGAGRREDSKTLYDVSLGIVSHMNAPVAWFRSPGGHHRVAPILPYGSQVGDGSGGRFHLEKVPEAEAEALTALDGKTGTIRGLVKEASWNGTLWITISECS